MALSSLRHALRRLRPPVHLPETISPCCPWCKEEEAEYRYAQVLGGRITMIALRCTGCGVEYDLYPTGHYLDRWTPAMDTP